MTTPVSPDIFKYGLDSGQFPRTLYKYTSVENLLLTLNNHTLKFSQITEFNDDKECFAILDFNCTANDWTKYLLSHVPDMPLEKLAGMVARIMRDPKLASETITEAIKTANINLGILCLTTSPDNPDMWSYYTSNRGVCIEFDLSADLTTFCFPKKVVYDDNLHKFNYIKSWNTEQGRSATDAIFHKESRWSHEDEYRIVKINGAGLKKFNIDAIRSITFGTMTPEKEIAEVKNLVTSTRALSHIKLYRRILDKKTGNYNTIPV